MADVLTGPAAAKAAITAGGSDLVHFSFPIEKSEDTATINPVDNTPDIEIWGKATDGTLDSDLQIVDPDWSLRALKTWFDTKANIRMQHDPKRPVGKGVEVDGHHVRARISDPLAKHFVRTGVLNDFSVGIINPDIRKHDPRFAHLPDWDKAVGGVITGRTDGLSGFGELSVVDRGSNYGTKFSLVKAASDGTPEWVGTLSAPEEVLAKASLPSVTKERKPAKTVTVELPRNMSVSIKPSDLAKLAALRPVLARENALAKAATPTVAKTAESPVTKREPVDHAVLDGQLDEALKAIGAAEGAVLGKDSRTFTAGQRREHASGGTALADGSYPMPDADAVRRAAILIRSKHGNWKAAAKLLGRRVKALGIPNPLKKKPAGEATKAATPDVAKCGCDGGMLDGKPCPDCKKGKKAGKRMGAKAASPKMTKKKKVMCGNCGARQNRKHNMCSECGKDLAGAIPVMKNHAYTCLGCGKDLDKGEKFCPQCGKENPGYLPEADHQIPANKTTAAKAGKDRVTKGRKNSGKPRGKTPAGASGAVSAPEKPVGPHREPDGAEVDAFEADAGMSDGDHETPTHLEAHTLKPAPGRASKAAKMPKGKKGGKGKKPKKMPPWMKDKDGEQDGAEKAATFNPYGDPEVAAALRLKTLGVPLALGTAHDLLCPAFDPADVRACYPAATLKSLDLTDWQARAVGSAAELPVTEAQKGLELWNAALVIKQADPIALADLTEGAYKGFRSANIDAQQGPSSFPTPTQLSPQRFNRPYITEGRAAPSPGQDPPHHAKIPPVGGIHPEDFTRGYISEGRAADSPSNTHPAGPMGEPGRTGSATNTPAQAYFRDSARDSVMHATQVLHDHIAMAHPGLCPMRDLTANPVPTPAGVAPVTPAPGTRKSAEKSAKVAAKRAERKAVRAGKRKAARIRAKAAARRRAVEAKVLKGKMTVNDARAKLGLEPFGTPDAQAVTKAATAAPTASQETPAAAAALDPEAFAAAVTKATKPLVKRIAAQDKTLRKQGKVLDAIAGQPDTTGAPFRGVGLPKSSAAPAGPQTVAKSAQAAQQAMIANLYDEVRNNPDPGARKVAWDELARLTWNAPMNPPPT